MENINSNIDHTCLGKKVEERDLRETVEEAREYNMNVCINPTYLKKVEEFNQKVVTVVGFPMGQNSVKSKLTEAKEYISAGADEIDYCCNLEYLEEPSLMREEFQKMSQLPVTVKAIIETGLLEKKEIEKMSRMVDETEIDYVKTCSGFFGGGVRLEDVKTIDECISSETKIKASGGIKSGDFALKLIDMGVDRIGASSGVEIVEDLS